MDWSEFKAYRQVHIDKMEANVQGVEKYGHRWAWFVVPAVLLLVIILPYNWIRLVLILLRVWAETIYRLTISPFLILYLGLDLSIVTAWYFGRIIKRMSEKP